MSTLRTGSFKAIRPVVGESGDSASELLAAISTAWNLRVGVEDATLGDVSSPHADPFVCFILRYFSVEPRFRRQWECLVVVVDGVVV